MNQSDQPCLDQADVDGDGFECPVDPLAGWSLSNGMCTGNVGRCRGAGQGDDADASVYQGRQNCAEMVSIRIVMALIHPAMVVMPTETDIAQAFWEALTAMTLIPPSHLLGRKSAETGSTKIVTVWT